MFIPFFSRWLSHIFISKIQTLTCGFFMMLVAQSCQLYIQTCIPDSKLSVRILTIRTDNKVAGFPTPPDRGPFIKEVTGHYLTLSWIPTRRSPPRYPQVTYVIEVRELPEREWRLVGDNVLLRIGKMNISSKFLLTLI